MINEVKSYFNSQGVRARINKRDDTNCSVVTVYNKKYWKMFREMYDDKKEKIFPEFYREFGKNIKYILEGWLDGDGWILKDRNTYDVYGFTTSRKLALGMRDVALSVGYYAVIRCDKRWRYEKRTKDGYTVSIKYGLQKQGRLRKMGDIYGGYTNKLKEYQYKGEVYDLMVKDDNSFIVEGMAVHNCVDSLALAVWTLDPKVRRQIKEQKKSIPIRKKRFQYL